MSSAVFSTSAAESRPFVFDGETEGEVRSLSGSKKPALAQSAVTQAVQSTIKNRHSAIPLVTPASRLEIRPAPEMASSGIPALDALTGGLPRGCLTEICGPASSGRTSVMLAALAAATRRGEYCAVIDASDSMDPNSVAASSVDLDRLLWVRCNENSPQRYRDTEKTNHAKKIITNNSFVQSKDGTGTRNDAALAAEVPLQNSNENLRNRKRSEQRLEQVLRATDLLLESGGFGLIILDLADLPWETARRIPVTTWFRFRRAVENKLTILLATGQQSITGSCSSLLMQLGVPSSQFSVLSANQSSAEGDVDPRTATQNLKPSHTQFLTELKINAQLIRSRLDRKPSRSITFETKTAWAG